MQASVVNKANFIVLHVYGDGSAMLLCSWCNQLFIDRENPQECPLCHSNGKLVKAESGAH